MTFGLWLRDQRQQRDMTQSAAALSLGISPQYYHDLERGRRDPSPRVIQELYLTWDIPYALPTLRAGYAPNSVGISGAPDETLLAAWEAFLRVLTKED